jgi:quercetin dioxygenase-like cupin family protein
MISNLRILLLGLVFSSQLWAVDDKPVAIKAADLEWLTPLIIPGLVYAWVLGDEKKPGLYMLRATLSDGTIIPPHTHPDKRNNTVLSGTLYVGFGDSFNIDKLVEIKQGEIYTTPAGTPHFLMAKDGDVTYQESGIGPTATTMIKENRE